MNTTQCQACGKDVLIDRFGFGKCKNCGWIKSNDAVAKPDQVIYPNITCLNHAKELISENKKLKPTFEEFISIIKKNLEPCFKYKGKTYGNTNFDGFEFFEFNKEECYQKYNDLETFTKKANINGVLLKDLWDKIYNFKLNC